MMVIHPLGYSEGIEKLGHSLAIGTAWRVGASEGASESLIG